MRLLATDLNTAAVSSYHLTEVSADSCFVTKLRRMPSVSVRLEILTKS